MTVCVRVRVCDCIDLHRHVIPTYIDHVSHVSRGPTANLLFPLNGIIIINSEISKKRDRMELRFAFSDVS